MKNIIKATLPKNDINRVTLIFLLLRALWHLSALLRQRNLTQMETDRKAGKEERRINCQERACQKMVHKETSDEHWREKWKIHKKTMNNIYHKKNS